MGHAESRQGHPGLWPRRAPQDGPALHLAGAARPARGVAWHDLGWRGVAWGGLACGVSLHPRARLWHPRARYRLVAARVCAQAHAGRRALPPGQHRVRGHAGRADGARQDQEPLPERGLAQRRAAQVRPTPRARRLHAAACAPQAHGCSQRARVLRGTVALPPSPMGEWRGPSLGAVSSTPSPPALLATGPASPGTPPPARHARHNARLRAAAVAPRQELPHPPSPCAGTTASTSTTTTRSSSASAAPGACSRSSSGTARWACRSRCAPLPRPAFGPTLVGWPRRAGACARHRSRTSACVCATTPCDLTSLLLTFADLLLAAAKVGHVRVDQHFPQEQPRRPQVRLRRARATPCSVHVDACAARAVLPLVRVLLCGPLYSRAGTRQATAHVLRAVTPRRTGWRVQRDRYEFTLRAHALGAPLALPAML